MKVVVSHPNSFQLFNPGTASPVAIMNSNQFKSGVMSGDQGSYLSLLSGFRLGLISIFYTSQCVSFLRFSGALILLFSGAFHYPQDVEWML